MKRPSGRHAGHHFALLLDVRRGYELVPAMRNEIRDALGRGLEMKLQSQDRGAQHKRLVRARRAPDQEAGRAAPARVEVIDASGGGRLRA